MVLRKFNMPILFLSILWHFYYEIKNRKDTIQFLHSTFSVLLVYMMLVTQNFTNENKDHKSENQIKRAKDYTFSLLLNQNNSYILKI